MPQFPAPDPAPDPACDTIAALREALDLLGVGVAVLDRDLRTRIITPRFAEVWALPESATPTLRQLADAVCSFNAQEHHPTFWGHPSDKDARQNKGLERDPTGNAGSIGSDHAPDAPGDAATAADQLAEAISAGAIPSAVVRLADGARRLLRCMIREDGGRVLTCAELATPDDMAAHALRDQDAAERLAVELRFSNETLESQAAYLASLAEAADANAQAAEEAKRQLQREIAERRQLEARLRHMAATDTLTGTLSRAQFLALGQREVERVRQQGLSLALLMLDIDHFKSINDRYGHPAGDAALCHLVTQLRPGIRRIDLLGRLGGEEFGIVLPAIGREPAAVVAERLRAAVAGHKLTYAQHEIAMSVSIGLAMLADGDGGMEQLLGRADALLYAAKRAGRNRVVSEAEPIAA